MLVLTLFFSVVITSNSIAQESSLLKTDIDKQDLISELTRVIPALMETAVVPGLSIALIRDAEIIWYKGFGVKNAKTGEPVTENTIFEAASLSKPVFAYAVLQMIENGDLDLDVPLIEYVTKEYIEKEFLRNPIEDERFYNITARMVLSHTPGFPNWRRGRIPLPIINTPGKKFSYSGEGFVYLQKVVEHIKKKPLNDIMQSYVFGPLEMKNSSYVWIESYDDLSGVGHNLFGETTGRFRKRTRANAAASLFTTAQDYARCIAAIMKETRLEDGTVREMLSPQSTVEENVFWGLGFGLQRSESGNAYWHWGDNSNFRCFFVAFKEQKIGVVYFTNSYNGLSIPEEIVQCAIGGSHPALSSGLVDYERYNTPGSKFARAFLVKSIEEAVELYHKLKSKHPVAFSETGINDIGYQFLRSKKMKEAIAIFKLNVEAYPNSANTYDSLAEAYMTNGDNDLAIKFYKKVLEAIPDDPRSDKDNLENLKKGALEKLKELEKK